MDHRATHWFQRHALASLALGLAYFVTGRLGTLLALPSGYATAIFPASGLALAALMSRGLGLWPGILLGSFCMNAWITSSNSPDFSLLQFFPVGISIGLGASIEAILGVYILRRFTGSNDLLGRVKNVIVFLVFSGLAASMVSASVGVTSLCLAEMTHWGDFLETWFTWWLGDAMGIFVFTPLTLILLQPRTHRLKFRFSFEGACFLFLICFVTWMVFQGKLGSTPYPLMFLAYPLLVWAVFRFQPFLGILGVFIISIISILQTINGHGPFAQNLSTNESLLLLQTFIGVASFMTLLLIATLTERQQAEESLRKNQERLEKTERFSHVMVTHVGLDGTWLKVPPTLCELLGYTEEELLSDKLESVTHPDDFMADWSQCQRLIAGEIKSFDLEKRYIRKDGQIVWIYLNCSVVEDEAGKPLHFLTYIRDISEKKRLEEELQQYSRDLEKRVKERTLELERSNGDLEEFAYIASHDLQEPLRKITVFGDRLKKKIIDSDEQGQDYLARMQKSALRMQSFIDDLLEFSRVKTQTRPAQTTDLEKLIRGMEEDLEPLIHENKATIHIGSFPTLSVDRVQFHNLFQNLISNSIKYHKQGVPPVITLSSLFNQETGCWEFRVEDNGIGFEEKYLDRIFKPFERLHGRSAYEGTGIGLAICEKIVHRHGGSITAKSQPGQGATFIISLPKDRTDPTQMNKEGVSIQERL
jgi:PAS domain S-box-containing protein